MSEITETPMAVCYNINMDKKESTYTSPIFIAGSNEGEESGLCTSCKSQQSDSTMSTSSSALRRYKDQTGKLFEKKSFQGIKAQNICRLRNMQQCVKVYKKSPQGCLLEAGDIDAEGTAIDSFRARDLFPLKAVFSRIKGDQVDQGDQLIPEGAVVRFEITSVNGSRLKIDSQDGKNKIRNKLQFYSEHVPYTPTSVLFIVYNGADQVEIGDFVQKCKNEANLSMTTIPVWLPFDTVLDWALVETQHQLEESLSKNVQLQSTVDALQSTVDEQQSTMVELQRTVDEQQSTMVELQRTVNEQRSTIVELQSNMQQMLHKMELFCNRN
eukprot:Colp12_sorted_trinity150504_noHs@9559